MSRGEPRSGKGAARLEVPKLCLPDVQATTAALTAKWQPVGADIGKAKQREERILRGQLQPLVAEQIRLTVDAQMRQLLHNLRVRHSSACCQGVEARDPCSSCPLPLSGEDAGGEGSPCQGGGQGRGWQGQEGHS